jgi:arylsulfatase A-like enzyme
MLEISRRLTGRLCTTVLQGALLLVTSTGLEASTNVVFILTDDQGHWAIHSKGSDDCQSLKTPNLDRLAKQGTRFTEAFVVSPVCSPSRATWLTGRIPSQHGVQDWILPAETYGEDRRSFVEGQPTFSQALADQGYSVGLCGKWHLGDDARPQVGFTYWSTVPGGGGTYLNPKFAKNGRRFQREGYKTDLLGDDALEFIEQNKNRPFFLFLSFYAPHTPLRYQTEEYRAPYLDSEFPCFPDLPMHPSHMREMNGRVSGHLRDFSKRHSKLSYAALVTGIDSNVGRVLDKINELGLRENTVIIFASDHGFHAGHEGIWGKGNGTVPFNLYERSIKIPLIWSHPGRIPAARQIANLVNSYDFLPTLFDYLQLEAPVDESRVGRSYAHLLVGEDGNWDDEVYFEYEYVRGIRTKRWKYVERTSEWPSELFDLKHDPVERRNILSYPQHSALVEELRQRLHQFFEKAGAPPAAEWRSTTQQQLAVYK